MKKDQKIFLAILGVVTLVGGIWIAVSDSTVKDTEKTQKVEIEESEPTASEKLSKESKITDIVFNEKPNVYLFWGKGCSFCEKTFEFLDELRQERGDIYNLYTFEIWGDGQENSDLMKQFAEAIEEPADKVPFTIIGDVSFYGFSDEIKEDMTEEITTYKAPRDREDDPIYKLVQELKSSDSKSKNQKDDKSKKTKK